MSAGSGDYGGKRNPGYQTPDESRLDNIHIAEKHDAELGHERRTSIHEGEQMMVHEGEEKFNQLGWKRLTICLVVEAVALGSLSIPSAFATLGMIPGVIICLAMGVAAIYTAVVVGQVKLRYPAVNHYADAVALIWGRFGYELTSVMFVLFLVLVVGSHALTGTIAFVRIINQPGVCAVVWSVISAFLLFFLALPSSFAEFSWLGYIDFAAIILAIMVTIVSTGIEAHNSPGGLSAVDWSAWPAPGTTFSQAFLATTNIIFAYCFAVCQFSFMSEMHTPKDYTKAITVLGSIEIFIYTVTGGLVYAFVGSKVESPALLSSSFTVSRIAFGIALPVIFISGSINSTVVGKYIMDRAFRHSSIRYINDVRGWAVWASLIATITLVGWVIAESIPFFNALLGLISSLFISGFTFYFPALFWFYLVREGGCFSSKKNIILTLANASCFVVGIIVLVCGTYASVTDIMSKQNSGHTRAAFSCDSSDYTA